MLDSGGRAALIVQTIKKLNPERQVSLFGSNVARGSLVFSKTRRGVSSKTKNRHDRAPESEVTPFGAK